MTMTTRGASRRTPRRSPLHRLHLATSSSDLKHRQPPHQGDGGEGQESSVDRDGSSSGKNENDDAKTARHRKTAFPKDSVVSRLWAALVWALREEEVRVRRRQEEQQQQRMVLFDPQPTRHVPDPPGSSSRYNSNNRNSGVGVGSGTHTTNQQPPQWQYPQE
jgi:hypothetical protein